MYLHITDVDSVYCYSYDVNLVDSMLAHFSVFQNNCLDQDIVQIGQRAIVSQVVKCNFLFLVLLIFLNMVLYRCEG